MPDKVYEGVVDLNTKPFVEGTEQLETLAPSVAEKVLEAFKKLDAGVSQALTSIKSQANTLGQALNAVASATTTSSTQSTASTAKMASSAKTAKDSAEKLADSAVRLAQAQSRGLAISGEYAKAIQNIQTALNANPKASEKVVANANNQIAALEKRAQAITAALAAEMKASDTKAAESARKDALSVAQKQAQDAAKSQREQQRQDELAQKAANEASILAAKEAAKAQADAEKIAADNKMTLLRQNLATEEKLRAENNANSLARMKIAGKEEQQELQKNLAAETAALKSAIEQQQKLRFTSLREQEYQINNKVADTKFGTSTYSDTAYRESVRAAEQAAAKEASLRRQLTEQMKTEANAQKQYMAEGYDNKEAIARALKGQDGFFAALRAGVEKARQDLKQVEDQWNSIYRAGSQLSQLGGMATALGGGIAYTGSTLVEGAADFDFWAGRAVAAAKAANAQMDLTTDTALVNRDAFKNLALEVGRAVGADNLTDLSKSVYTYQAALGDTIQTAEDFALAQKNIEATAKLGIIADIDPTTIVQGTSAVLGEFKLTADEYVTTLATMNAVGQTTQAEFSDIMEAFQKVGPQAQRLGLTVGDVAGIFGELANAGVKGGSAGRLLASGFTNLVKPSKEANDKLQEVLATSRGLAGTWRDQVFTNGKFDFTKFMTNITEGTKGLRSERVENVTATLFGKEASRTWATMINQYRTHAEEIEKIRKNLNSSSFVNNSFEQQWLDVADTLRVKLGEVKVAFAELGERVGSMIGQEALPLLEVAKKLVYGFIEWAKVHPEVAAGVVKVAVALTALLTVVGPVLAGLGFMIQGIAGLRLAAETLPKGIEILSGAMKGLGVTFQGTGAIIGGINVPILALLALIIAFAIAWRYNWGGIRDIVAQVGESLKPVIESLGVTLSGLLTVITGVMNGSDEVVQRGVGEMINGFAGIATGMVQVVYDTGDLLTGALADLSYNMGEWGANLVYSLVDGMLSAQAYLANSMISLLQNGIANFIESHSPPRYGPLRKTTEWGYNLMDAYNDGISAYKFDSISEVGNQIKEALTANIQDGLIDPSVYESTMAQTNNLLDDMFTIVDQGGRVDESFFEPLQENLGEWYQYVTDIALAYQEVYANQQALEVEQQKLDLIKAQREELQRQADLRTAEYDKYLNGTNTSSYEANKDKMVDPTTAEGQAKIKEMQSKLSKEEFQNWLNFQKSLWEQKSAQEDASLAAQEDAQQATVDSIQVQLDAAQKQYELYQGMYNYAVEMYNLAEEQQKLQEEQDAKNKEKINLLGTPEQLNAFKDEIAKIVGGDKVIRDETQLRDARGGNDIQAFGDAAKQVEAEQNRLSELEKANRRKRAEFEAQLINAKSDAERNEIKQQKDAWDAAYKDEKARLQERIQAAKDVLDAAEKQADLTAPGREEEYQKQYQKEIDGLLGDQTNKIEDANQLKGESKNLDEASIKAREQMREEERKLKDLQALGDQKKLEFQQRINDAAKDPEKLRVIKEEQAAWDESYKRALEAQQARVEAARRTQQDIQDQKADEGRKKKGGEGLGPRDGGIDIGGAGGKIDPTSGYMGFVNRINDAIKKAFDDAKPPSALDKVKLAIKFLGDESVPASVKIGLLLESLTGTKGIMMEVIKLTTTTADWGQRLAALDVIAKAALPGFLEFLSRFYAPFTLVGESLILGMSNFFADMISKAIGPERTKQVGEFVNSIGTTIQLGWDSTVTATKTFIGNLGNEFTSAFDPANPKSWLSVATLGLSNILFAIVDTFDPTKGKAVDGFFKGISAMLNKILLVFSLEEDGSLPKTFFDGIENMLKKTLEFFDPSSGQLTKAFLDGLTAILEAGLNAFGIDKDGSIVKTIKTGVDAIKSAIDFAFGDGDNSLQKIVENGVNNVVAAIFGAFGVDADSSIVKIVQDAVNSIVPSFDTIFSPIESFINALSGITFPSIPDWLGGGGGQSTGEGGGGGGSWESSFSLPGFAMGLERVPYDDFVARLHKNERVLTAEEAAAYKAYENARRIPSSTINNTSSTTATKNVVINIGKIDANTADQGKAFAKSLAWLDNG